MKKPKEEAERIIDMFRLPKARGYVLSIKHAKECAILHVEGIIEAMEDFVFRPDYEIRKWQEVLQIIKLK